MQEIWKDIKGYESHYQVSNLGRIKSLYFKNKYGVIHREKILKTGFNKKYYHVILSNEGETKMFYVHRLVAEAFIPNPENKPQINHIDGNKTNNNVNNLEWCTPSHNVKEAYKIGLIKIKKGSDNYHFNKPSKRRKKVGQYDKNNNLIRIWDCAGLVEKELNISANNIRECCRNNRLKAGNYIWKYL